MGDGARDSGCVPIVEGSKDRNAVHAANVTRRRVLGWLVSVGGLGWLWPRPSGGQEVLEPTDSATDAEPTPPEALAVPTATPEPTPIPDVPTPTTEPTAQPTSTPAEPPPAPMEPSPTPAESSAPEVPSVEAQETEEPTEESTATSTPTPTPVAVWSPFADDFEDGDLRLWDHVEGLAIQDAVVLDGRFAAQSVSVASGPAFARAQLAAPQPEVHTRLRFTRNADGPDAVYLLRLMGADDAPVMGIFLAPNGVLARKIDAIDERNLDDGVVAVGDWHELLVSVRIDSEGGIGSIAVTLDGQPRVALSGEADLGSVPLARVQIGDHNPDRIYDVAFDGLLVDAEPIGPDPRFQPSVVTDGEQTGAVASPTPTPGGLHGEYFDRQDLTDTRLTRLDPTIDFAWATGSPDPAIGADSFSVRWTGQFRAGAAGTYTFSTISNDGVRLWVNGAPLIDNWTAHPVTENSSQIALEADTWYPLRLEYFEGSGSSTIRLSYATSSISKQVIPSDLLSPEPGVEPPPPTPTPPSTEPDQIHLAWVNDSASTLTVIWRTPDTASPSEVEYRVVGAASWLVAAGGLRPSGTAGTLHEVTLTGLSPSTAYEYRVRGGVSGWSDVSVARTAPARGPADFDAIYLADTGLAGRTDGLATGTQQVVDEIAALNPLLLLAGGDYIYFDTDKRYGTLEKSIDAWFAQMRPIASRSVMMPTYGNHEVLPFGQEGFAPWAARFPTPEGFDSRRNYSFDAGDVHFISVFAVEDSAGLSSGQLQWLEQDILAAKAAGQRWIVPYYHVSPYANGSNHSSNTALRRQLGPLFERHGIKIALSSHDQAYERTFPLTGAGTTDTPTTGSLTCYGSSDGVIWIKVSPGGKKSNLNGDFSRFRTNPAPHWTAFRSNTSHCFTRLIFSAGGSIRVETYGVRGDGSPAFILEQFEITSGFCPDATPAPTPTAAPTATSTPTASPAATATPGGSPGTGGLLGEYFDTQNLTGTALTRVDPSIDFAWGSASPDPAIGAESFSVRWTGRVLAPVSGNYTFSVLSNDGARLWVDGRQLVDDWAARPVKENTGQIVLEEGRWYPIRLEYFEGAGTATVRLSWTPPGGSKQVISGESLDPEPGSEPTPAPTPTATSSPAPTVTPAASSTPGSTPIPTLGGLQGEYFDSTDLTNLKLTRIDPMVDFAWGSASPDPAIGPDTFSVRWTGFVQASVAGTYTFFTASNDGVRLWVDGRQLVNDWTAHPVTENSGQIVLEAGRWYPIRLEYYEGSGTATVRLSWTPPGGAKQIVPSASLGVG